MGNPADMSGLPFHIVKNRTGLFANFVFFKEYKN